VKEALAGGPACAMNGSRPGDDHRDVDAAFCGHKVGVPCTNHEAHAQRSSFPGEGAWSQSADRSSATEAVRQVDQSQWQVKEGEAVVYTDARGVDRAAVVTKVWGQRGEDGKLLDPMPAAPSVNLVYVSGDQTREDDYGRQIERATSVVWTGNQAAPGISWRRP